MCSPHSTRSGGKDPSTCTLIFGRLLQANPSRFHEALQLSHDLWEGTAESPALTSAYPLSSLAPGSSSAPLGPSGSGGPFPMTHSTQGRLMEVWRAQGAPFPRGMFQRKRNGTSWQLCHPSCPCYLALGPARVLSRVCPSLLPPQQIINLNQDFLLVFFQKLLSSQHLGFPWKPGWQRWASPALLRL